MAFVFLILVSFIDQHGVSDKLCLLSFFSLLFVIFSWLCQAPQVVGLLNPPLGNIQQQLELFLSEQSFPVWHAFVYVTWHRYFIACL